MQSLNGFRDFYPEDCARRDYLLGRWRAVARRSGFVEIDSPVLEPTELYAKKNETGAEIMRQLYNFTDKGGRDVSLRPELTPTLARMVAARERHYRKPLKWFSIASFFRYERPQKGRLREFIQFNADIIGDSSPGADAELIALVIDILHDLGFTSDDFVLRLSDRRAWTRFLESRHVAEPREVLAIVDKIERESAESLDAKLAPHGLTTAEVREFIASGSPDDFSDLLADLTARGLRDFVEIDLSIVRGLAYYTGLVFEAFDCGKNNRALAGGGRYDTLMSDLSDGSCDLPAVGFGMGDVVLGDFIDNTPAAAAKRPTPTATDLYVIIADETKRPQALALITNLRTAGLRTDFPLTATKLNKQFQTAEALGAQTAIIVGTEYPDLKLKTLATRDELTIPAIDLIPFLQKSCQSRQSS